MIPSEVGGCGYEAESLGLTVLALEVADGLAIQMGCSRVTGGVFDRSDWWDPDGFTYGMRELLNPIRIPYIVGHFREHHVRSVLDVGCGGGYITKALHDAAFATAGIDHSVLAINAAATNALGEGNGRFVVADARVLPFANEVFDGVVLSEVLEHVGNPAMVVKQAARALAPGGVMVVTGPNRTRLSRFVLIWLAQEWPTRVLPRDLHSHDAFIPTRQLRDWWEGLGLELIDITGVGIRLRQLPSTLATMAQLRRGTITYGQAGRAVQLALSRSSAIAYLGCARKPS